MSRVILDKLQSVSTLEELRRFVSKSLDALVVQFNGRVDFGDNIRSSLVEVEFTSSSAPFVVGHSLGRTPQGYIVIEQSAAGSVFRPDELVYVWSPTQIFLQSSAAMTAKILII